MDIKGHSLNRVEIKTHLNEGPNLTLILNLQQHKDDEEVILVQFKGDGCAAISKISWL